MQILQDLDHRERRARQDTLHQLRVVQEADVLIHVEDILVRETFDVFTQSDDVLQVLVLSVAVDGVVDYYPVVERIVVRGHDALFHGVLFIVVEGVFEAVVKTGLLRPGGVDFGGGVVVREDA